MSQESPDPLEAVVARITPPEPEPWAPPADITGALADLLGWWRGLAGAAPLQPADVIIDVDSASVEEAVAAGVAAADRAIDAGATLLVPRARRRDDHAARAVIGLLSRREASAVLAQPEGTSDRAWMHDCADIRDRMATVAEARGEPMRMLAELNGTDMAGVAAVLLTAAARRTPCLVDGTDELAAAIVADRLAHRAKGWWRAGSDSPDPARTAAIERIDLTPGLALGLADDAGHGAAATLALLTPLASPVDRGGSP